MCHQFEQTFKLVFIFGLFIDEEIIRLLSLDQIIRTLKFLSIKFFKILI